MLRLRLLSLNTWLIIINVTVFLLANVVLGRQVAEFGAGTIRYDGVTNRQISEGYVDRNVREQLPNFNGFGHPIYDRATRKVIGHERLSYRPVIEGFGHFSTGKALELQVWRFLTFQFLHVNWWHLLFNMLGLWFVGGLVEEYLGRKRYAAFYLLCGIAGALGYLLLNAVGYGVEMLWPRLSERVPGLLFNDVYTPLVGASAGVFGVLMAAAFIAPTDIVYVLNIIPMKMRSAVYLFLGLATANLIWGGTNAGGDAAHVGGAIAGYYFIRRTHLLRDFFQLVGGPSKPRPPARTPNPSPPSEIERILAKQREHGLASLTVAEREALRRSFGGS